MEIEDLGPPLKAATKQQLAEELTGRKDTPAIVVYRVLTVNGDPMWGYSHNIPTTDSVPEILRELARFLVLQSRIAVTAYFSIGRSFGDRRKMPAKKPLTIMGNNAPIQSATVVLEASTLVYSDEDVL